MSKLSAIAIEILARAETKLICLDVGGAGGLHPKMVELGTSALSYAFDADETECRRLNADPRKKVTTLHAAVGKANETLKFVLTRQRQSSSFHPFDMERCQYFKDVELNRDRYIDERVISFATKSLDAICTENGIETVDFVKLDAEGHELAILSDFSKSFLMCETEVTFHPIRQTAPLFDQVMAHMRGRGYMLLDMRRVYWNPDARKRIRNYAAKGVLIMGDALFVLDPFQPRNHSLLSQRDARFKLYALLALYGYGAVVLQVLDHLTSLGMTDDEERQLIEESVLRVFSRSYRGPPLFGRALRKGLSIVERFADLPVAITDGFGRRPDYQGDGTLGGGRT